MDKNPAYIKAITALKIEKKINENTSLRRIKYLNNIIEQNHRFIKKKVKYMLGFKSFKSAKKTLSGIEAMHIIKKDRLKILLNLSFLMFSLSI